MRDAYARRTVILANGDFPRQGGLARRILETAAHVICCDGAGCAYRRRMRRSPDAIVGDMDSSGEAAAGVCDGTTEIVRVADQDTNDLEKAAVWCERKGWRKPIILGAGGKREDHAIGNVFRALALGLEIVTDFGRFVPIAGRAAFRMKKGAAVSIFAPDPNTRMTSRGLVWPLDDVRFENLHCATLNRASAVRVILTADRPVSVYIAS